MDSERSLSRATIGVFAVSLLVGGWSIPFYYQSFSILYKFGIEKAFLRSGKMVGITLVLLVFFQLVMASRLAVIERIFSVKHIFSLHRLNGILIAVLVVIHPVLIKASENFTNYPFDKKYYAEFMGIGLLCIILVVSGTAICRPVLKMAYTSWLFQHRLGATLVAVVMPTHILWVSETFKSGLPRTAAVMIFFSVLILAVRVWLRRIAPARKDVKKDRAA